MISGRSESTLFFLLLKLLMSFCLFLSASMRAIASEFRLYMFTSFGPLIPVFSLNHAVWNVCLRYPVITHRQYGDAVQIKFITE